jgi:hypothetical protein
MPAYVIYMYVHKYMVTYIHADSYVWYVSCSYVSKRNIQCMCMYMVCTFRNSRLTSYDIYMCVCTYIYCTYTHNTWLYMYAYIQPRSSKYNQASGIIKKMKKNITIIQSGHMYLCRKHVKYRAKNYLGSIGKTIAVLLATNGTKKKASRTFKFTLHAPGKDLEALVQQLSFVRTF